jgi:hypothetical protein
LVTALGGKQANLFVITGRVDFRTAEPAHSAEALYLHTGTTGVGSVSTAVTFTAGRLYRSHASAWREIAPGPGWIVVDQTGAANSFNGALWGSNLAGGALTGATATVAGTGGIVPAPAAGQQASYLRGDGTWAALDITGQYVGSAATFAALPTANATNGDWAALTADEVGTGTAAAPQYRRGIYLYNGTAYSFAVALDAAVTLSGDFMGVAATFAALPATATHKATAVAGDWAALSANDVGTGTVAAPQYPRGVYQYNGTAYAFSFALGSTSTGDYIGAAATFATLPKTATHKATALAGDWALLTADVVGTGTASAPQYPRGVYAYDGTNFALSMAIGSAAMPYLFLPAASVTAAIAGNPTVAEFNTWLALPANAGVRNQFVYYTGTATNTDTATSIWFVDRAGLAKHIKVPSPALHFLSSADLTTAIAGRPTIAEFRTWLTGQTTVRDTVVWYNATTAQTGEATYAWFVDRSGNAATLRSINPFRAITGSATGTGQDGVAVPVQIALAAGKGLLTVTATNGATVTNINSVAGTCLVTCNGDNTELSHTTRDNATFTSLQQVGSFTPAAPTTYDGAVAITTGIDFNKCDLIEWQFRLTTDLRAISSFVPVVIGGATPTMEAAHGSGQISSFIATAADATLGKLTNVDCHGVAFEVISIRGWANAANGYVVATGREVRQAITLSANGGALNVNGATSATLFAGTSARVSVDVPVGQMVSIATTATPGVTVGIADARTGALEVAIAAGTTGTAAITVGFFTPAAPRIMTSVNAGIDVALGTLRFRMASGGNRSLQVSSNTGANVNITAHAIHHNGGQSAGVITMTATTTAAYVMAWNFGAAGEWMRAVINDTSSGRWYDVTLTVGSSYNNNALVGYEIL